MLSKVRTCYSNFGRRNCHWVGPISRATWQKLGKVNKKEYVLQQIQYRCIEWYIGGVLGVSLKAEIVEIFPLFTLQKTAIGQFSVRHY